MRVAVLGTGALGCVFAARLARHAEVWMLGTWHDGVAAVQQHGVMIEEPDGQVEAVRVHAAEDPDAAPPASVALILVKSYQTARAGAWAARILAPSGLAVTLQNGLDNGEVLAAALGAHRVAQGVTYIGATLLAPGRARLVASLPTYVGTDSVINGRISGFIGLLRDAGLEAYPSESIQGRLWGKAVVNAAINPLTALWRVPNGEVCSGAYRREVMAQLAHEAAAVGRARGVKLPFMHEVAYVASVCRATAGNRSSMLQDVESGRPTEIDSISGIIAAEGQRLGVAVPLTWAVWQLVRALTPPAPDAALGLGAAAPGAAGLVRRGAS